MHNVDEPRPTVAMHSETDPVVEARRAQVVDQALLAGLRGARHRSPSRVLQPARGPERAAALGKAGVR